MVQQSPCSVLATLKAGELTGRELDDGDGFPPALLLGLDPSEVCCKASWNAVLVCLQSRTLSLTCTA